MFRSIIFFILFYSIGLSAFAQQKTFDILYLKDGSVLKGQIIELILNQKVVFRLRNNQIIEFRYQEIEKIVKEEEAEEEDNTNSWDAKGNEERIIRAKFKGLNFVILNATVGVTKIEEGGKISNLGARNRNYEIGCEVGAQYLNMFSRRWGLAIGLGLANYTAQIPYYTDSFQRFYRYKIQDFYYLNIPVYFKFLTSRPETVNMYLDLGLEPAISFSKPAVSESIEINRMKLNFLFGIGIRIPFNETLSATIGYRSLSSITNAGWSDYLSQFSLEYSALQVSLMLQPWGLKVNKKR
jgi:hypothetical protein